MKLHEVRWGLSVLSVFLKAASNICIFIHMYTSIFLHISIHLCIHIYTYLHPHIYIPTQTYVYTYTHTYIATHVHTHVHTYTSTHTHSHTHTPEAQSHTPEAQLLSSLGYLCPRETAYGVTKTEAKEMTPKLPQSDSLLPSSLLGYPMTWHPGRIIPTRCSTVWVLTLSPE